jgi:hypothetical protein
MQICLNDRQNALCAIRLSRELDWNSTVARFSKWTVCVGARLTEKQYPQITSTELGITIDFRDGQPFSVLSSGRRIFQFSSNVAMTREVQDLKASLLRFQTIEGIQTDRNFERHSKAICPIFLNPKFASKTRLQI